MNCALCRTEGAINTSLAPAKIQLPFPDTFLVALLLFLPPTNTRLYLCVASITPPVSPTLSSGCFWQQLLRNERARLFFEIILLVTTSFKKLLYIKWTATRRPLFSAEWTNRQSLIKFKCRIKYPERAISRLWIKIDKLDVTCFIISLFTAQHVSNVSTSIFRSLRLIVGLFHVLYFSGSMCVGVTVWSGWGGVVSLCRMKH